MSPLKIVGALTVNGTVAWLVATAPGAEALIDEVPAAMGSSSGPPFVAPYGERALFGWMTVVTDWPVTVPFVSWATAAFALSIVTVTGAPPTRITCSDSMVVPA